MLSLTITGLGIYIAIVILTRILGKRSFSKRSSFDFAITVALASILATTILSDAVPLWKGIFSLFLFYLFQGLTAYFRRYSGFRTITDNTPIYLMKGNKVMYDNLKKAKVAESDLKAKLREANVLKIEQIRAVIFETTGDISVLHTTKTNIVVDEWLLTGVEN